MSPACLHHDQGSGAASFVCLWKSLAHRRTHRPWLVMPRHRLRPSRPGSVWLRPYGCRELIEMGAVDILQKILSNHVGASPHFEGRGDGHISNILWRLMRAKDPSVVLYVARGFCILTFWFRRFAFVKPGEKRRSGRNGLGFLQLRMGGRVSVADKAGIGF